MRPSLVIAPVAASLALLASIFEHRTRTEGLGAPPSNARVGIANARAAEIRRIQIHFDSVLTELPKRDLSLLSRTQKAKRANALTTLAAYRDRGIFPQNYDFPGQAIPYFVDRKTGTLCAVAHLLETSGRRDVVDRVARQNNNVWVGELSADQELAVWLDTNGLTLDEAAFIQVPYMGDESPVVSALGGRHATYNIGSAVAIGTSAAASLYNAFANANGRGKLGNVVGVTAGVVAMGFGAAAMADDAAPPVVGAASLLAGGVSTFLSTRGFMRHRSYVAAQRDAAKTSLIARTTIAPILPSSASGTTGTGVAINIRF